MPAPATPLHPRPIVCLTAKTKTLHFSIAEVQSRMELRQPDALSLEYTRSMMGFLLFEPAPTQIAMIGLGGGSLAKFCHRHLPQASICVVELNPYVIALRDEFLVPADSDRFSVIEADGAEFVSSSEQLFDVLLVDGYDSKGLPQALSSQRFYDDCYNTLTDHGILVVNLHADHHHYDIHVDRLGRSFAGAVLLVEDKREGNSIVFAHKGYKGKMPALGAQRRPATFDEKTWSTFEGPFARIVSALKAQPQ
jgi:spermidine synthase